MHSVAYRERRKRSRDARKQRARMARLEAFGRIHKELVAAAAQHSAEREG